jgi:hypothetical protein
VVVGIVMMMMLVNMVVVAVIAAALNVVMVAMPALARDDVIGMAVIVVTVMGAMLAMGVSAPSAVTYGLHRRFADGQ